MPHLYNTADVFVLPTRGEAFGLPFMESMACGTPCIATNWGGHTDFVNNDNGYLLPYSLQPSAVKAHTPWYRSNMKLAEADFNELKKTMRRAFENKQELKQKSILCRESVEQFYQKNDIGSLIYNRLAAIVL